MTALKFSIGKENYKLA